MKVKKIKKEKGFSMIEVMLATFLVTAGLVVVIALMGTGIKQAAQNKNNLIASFLAQEGIELVRNIRDTNWINSLDSFNGIGTSNDCRVDASSFDNLSCGQSNFDLYFGSDSVYSHSGLGSEKTKFSRRIIIENEASGEQKVVTSVVIWGEDFPSGNVNIDNCNSKSQCAFSRISLTKWKEE